MLQENAEYFRLKGKRSLTFLVVFAMCGLAQVFVILEANNPSFSKSSFQSGLSFFHYFVFIIASVLHMGLQNRHLESDSRSGVVAIRRTSSLGTMPFLLGQILGSARSFLKSVALILSSAVLSIFLYRSANYSFNAPFFLGDFFGVEVITLFRSVLPYSIVIILIPLTTQHSYAGCSQRSEAALGVLLPWVTMTATAAVLIFLGGLVVSDVNREHPLSLVDISTVFVLFMAAYSSAREFLMRGIAWLVIPLLSLALALSFSSYPSRIGLLAVSVTFLVSVFFGAYTTSSIGRNIQEFRFFLMLIDKGFYISAFWHLPKLLALIISFFVGGAIFCFSDPQKSLYVLAVFICLTRDVLIFSLVRVSDAAKKYFFILLVCLPLTSISSTIIDSRSFLFSWVQLLYPGLSMTNGIKGVHYLLCFLYFIQALAALLIVKRYIQPSNSDSYECKKTP